MQRKIVGVAGRNGSGKDEVVNYLHDQCGIPVLSAGDVVRKLAKKENRSPTRQNLHKISEKYMQQKGRDYLAKRLIEIIEENDWSAVAVTGVRSPQDVAAFRTHFGDDLRLVRVRVGNPVLRFERVRRRNETRDPKTWGAFIEQEREEEELFKIGQAVDQADFTIENSGSLTRLYQEIKESPLWEWVCA